MDEALTTERHEVWLCRTPPIERVRPLCRASEVGDPHARVDHRAVHDAGRNGWHLTGHDDDHRLVEQLGFHVPSRVARSAASPRLSRRERDQTVIVAALRLHEGGVGQPARALDVAGSPMRRGTPATRGAPARIPPRRARRRAVRRARTTRLRARSSPRSSSENPSHAAHRAAPSWSPARTCSRCARSHARPLSWSRPTRYAATARSSRSSPPRCAWLARRECAALHSWRANASCARSTASDTAPSVAPFCGDARRDRRAELVSRPCGEGVVENGACLSDHAPRGGSIGDRIERREVVDGTILMLTSPVGPPEMTRSSTTVGGGCTSTLVCTLRSTSRASWGDISQRGAPPAAASLSRNACVVGSTDGISGGRTL